MSEGCSNIFIETNFCFFDCFQSYRLGSEDSNSGGWKNGRRTAVSIIEGEEPVKKFKFPVCSSLSNVKQYVTQ